jgi:tRNA(adenine34) deaminase
MRRCLELARVAARAGEVPVGAIVVRNGQVIGEGHNRCEEKGTPLAHAEMEALSAALASTPDARLVGAVLYCSLEPCFMCTGALLHARVERVVFAARDPKFGACASLAELPSDRRLNHRCPVEEGLLAEESAALLRTFFQRLR